MKTVSRKFFLFSFLLITLFILFVLPSKASACTGYAYFEAPAQNTTFYVGSTYTISGWATFCSGPNGTNRDRVDLHSCVPGGACTYIGRATSYWRQDVVNAGWTCGNLNSNSDGWAFNWSPTIAHVGTRLILAPSINDAATTCVIWPDSGGTNGRTVTVAAHGICSATHYNCAQGSLGSTAEYPDANNPNYYAWQWWCNGLYGGTNVLCAENKPNCNTGTINCTAWSPTTDYICALSQSRTCTHDSYSGGGACKPTNYTENRTINTCSSTHTGYTCPGNVCTPPNCNATISCSGACSPATNTCSTNNGTRDGCTYTTYSGGGSCTPVAAPNQACTLSNCSAGYTCVSGSCITPPPAPTGLTASCPAPGTTATASWNASSGATSYSFYTQTTDHVFDWPGACTAPNICYPINAPTTSVSFTTVRGQTYQWFVAANNGAGYNVAGPATFYCSPPNCNATISCSGACSPAANTCSANNGTKGGCVYTTYSGGGICTQVTAPNQPCTQSNCSSGYDCLGGACLAPPTNLSASCPVPGTTANLSWTASSGATSYTLYASTTGHAYDWSVCGPTNLCTAVSGTSTSINSWFTSGSTYQWYVFPCNGASCGGRGATGPNFTCLYNNAQFISQTPPPSTIIVGQTATVSVTMKNTGNTTWPANSAYRLGSQNPGDNNNWGTTRINLASSVAPGASYTFTFNITAPATSGTYNFQWGMLQEAVQWFGGLSTNAAITVLPIADSNTPIGYERYGIAGYADTCVNIRGWACDLDSNNTQIKVDLWDSGTYLGQVTANGYPEAAINTVCGNSTVDHGYSWTIPDSLKNGVNHIVTAYGLNINNIGQLVGTGNPALTGSPATINCALPPPTPTVSASPSCIPGDTSSMYTISWSSTSPAVTWVDISKNDSSFGAGYYHKQITSPALSTTASSGFTWYSGSSALIFEPNTTYYVRTYNGYYNSAVTQFTTPVLCNCTTAPVCSGCTGATTNTCSVNNATQTSCQYTATTGGGACNPVSAPNIPNSCTLDNCSAGFSCIAGSCVTTLAPLTGKIYRITGNYTIENDITVSTPGIIFVDGNLYINKNLTSTNPKAGLIFIVKGTIYIKRDVTTVNAFMIAHGKAPDGTTDIIPFCSAYDPALPAVCSDYSDLNSSSRVPLTINGSVISFNTNTAPQFVRKKIDINTGNVPAEVINYEPKYLIMSKNVFSRDLKVWQEIQ